MPSPKFEKLLGALFRNKRPAGSLDVAAMRRGMETPAFPVADDVQVESLVLAFCWQETSSWLHGTSPIRDRRSVPALDR